MHTYRPSYRRPPIDRTDAFYRFLIQCGVTLAIVDGELIPTGATELSPVLLQQIQKRKAALLPLVRDRERAEE